MTIDSFFAYIDPGTGSVFIQVVMGVVLAGAVIFRAFIGKTFRNVKLLFSRKHTNGE